MTCGLNRQSLMNISSSWKNQQAITTKKPKPATLVQTKLNAREISAMTVKCTFCNDTKQEPGFPGPCVWCETAAESIKFGTGIMFVGADGAKNVPLGDVLIETKAFRLLPYGTKFRYQSTQDVWVRIGHNLVAKWPCDLFGRDGQPCQSLCSFCHLEGDDSGDTLETLVEVVDAELALIAERDAAMAREAALLEELSQYEPASPGTASKRARWLINIQDACKYGLPKHLVNRLNNTAKEIQNSIKFGGTKRLRDENESLQQRLTVAEQHLARAMANITALLVDACPEQFAALKIISEQDAKELVRLMLDDTAALKPAAEG